MGVARRFRIRECGGGERRKSYTSCVRIDKNKYKADVGGEVGNCTYNINIMRTNTLRVKTVMSNKEGVLTPARQLYTRSCNIT